MGALIPLLISVAPTVADWLFGDKTGAAVKEATDIAKKVFGTDNADAIKQAIATDPNKALELQKALIEAKSASEQRQHEEVMANIDTLNKQIADISNARNQTIELAKANSAIAWGAPVISSLILSAFTWCLWLVMTKSIPSGQEELIYIMLGALTTMTTNVANYWLGSTSGSLNKTNLLAQTSNNSIKALAPVKPAASVVNNVSGPTVKR